MMMKMIFGAIGGMNLAGETEVLGGNLPRRHFVHHKIPPDDPVSNPGPQRWKPATNRLSYGAALVRLNAQQSYWTVILSECTISATVLLHMMELYAAPQKSLSHG
jgi:hypothetical protein